MNRALLIRRVITLQKYALRSSVRGSTFAHRIVSVSTRRDDADFAALLSEAALAAEALAFGATVLRRANYAHQGYYAQAFFSLSIGFERCGKLALALDHALDSGGSFPSKKTLMSYGHNLGKLLAKTDATAKKRGFATQRPGTAVHDAIVSTLSDFATNVTRYYNLEFIARDPSTASRDSPAAAWYQKVSQPIAAAHYSTQRRKKDEARAQAVEAMTRAFTSVRFYSEEGTLIDSVFEGSRRTAERNAVIPWERMYLLHFARYFGSVLTDLAHDAQSVGLVVPHLSEFFAIFDNDDSYFRSRKTWSIYP